MRPSFHCQLLNSPFADPGMLVHLAFQKRSLLFDLGDLSAVPAADLLKVDHIFVTHTHMDHFIGFDQILRLFLGRSKRLHLYGPKGFLKNVAGKLSAYTWNLVRNYEEALELEVSEIEGDRKITQTFNCSEGFKPSSLPQVQDIDKVLHQEQALSVSAVILDHQIPCLSFNLQERFHINILKSQLEELCLGIGSWIKSFKKLLYAGADPSTEIRVPSSLPNQQPQTFTVEELSTKVARISRGQKIAYVTDAIYTPANEEKIISLSHGADHLFIEAAFLDKDREIAQAKYHLTARQAGLIARKACVRKVTVFHFSPRYTDTGNLLAAEAQMAFEGLI